MDLERFDAIFGQHTGLSAGSKHERNVRTVNISVKEPGLVAKFGQGRRKVHRQCGLTNASLARANGNNRVNARKRLRPWRGLSGTRRHVRGQEITLGEEMSRLDYTGSGLCGGGRSRRIGGERNVASGSKLPELLTVSVRIKHSLRSCR